VKTSGTKKHRLLLGIGFGVIGVLVLTAIVLVAAIVHRAVQPSTVIVRCAENGAAVIANPAAPDAPRDEKAVRYFLERFFTAYFARERKEEGASVERMISPAFTRTASASWQPPQWEDEELRAVVTVHRLTLSGEPTAGRTLQVMGTAEALFTPRVRLEASDVQEVSVPFFFQATLFVEPLSERIPYGLLVHWLEVRFFENDDLLKTFLEKAEVR